MRLCFCAVPTFVSSSDGCSCRFHFSIFPFLHLYILTLMGDFMISATSSCCCIWLVGSGLVWSFCYKGPLKSSGLGTQKPHRTLGVDAICICKILLGPISESGQQEFPQLIAFGFYGLLRGKISRLFGHKAFLRVFALMVLEISSYFAYYIWIYF